MLLLWLLLFFLVSSQEVQLKSPLSGGPTWLFLEFCTSLVEPVDVTAATGTAEDSSVVTKTLQDNRCMTTWVEWKECRPTGLWRMDTFVAGPVCPLARCAIWGDSTPSPPRDRSLTSIARCFLRVWRTTCWRCVSFWFVRVLCVCASSACACSLRVCVLCLYLASESDCRSVTQQFLKGKKKIRNRLIYSLLLVEVELIGQWEELEPPAVLLVLWSTQLGHLFHVSSTQREIWQLLLQHW